MAPPPKTIRIHDLAEGLAALAAHGDADGLTLLSPVAAAGVQGVGWWLSLTESLRRAHPDSRFDAVLDCGHASGHALAALRLGVRDLCLAADAPGFARLARLAAAIGVSLRPTAA